MSDRSDYRDPIIQAIIDFLETDGPSEMRSKYINGDLLKPQLSDLPVCYLAFDNTDAGPADNMEDEHTMAVVAVIVLNTANSLEGAYDLAQGTPELYDMCQGRESNFWLKETSFLYQLTKHQQIAPKLWLGVGTPVHIEYGLGIERRGPGIFSIEATITFNVRLHQPHPGIPLSDI